MTVVKAVRSVLHSAAGLSRFLTGGPHGKHSGSPGLGHDCRDPPCIQPNLFKLELKFRERWGEVVKARGREANIYKQSERKLFHNVYRLVSWCCLSHIRPLHKDFAKADDR